MRNKSLFVTILSAVFIVVVIAVAFFSISINEFDFDFSLYDGASEHVEYAKDSVKDYLGKNLFFTDASKIKETIEKDSYLKCVSVEKKYPNKIKVKIEERKAVYYFSYEEKNFLLDKDGFILEEYNGEITRDLIELGFNNVEIISFETGKNIKTNKDDILSVAFSVAKNARLTDCIKMMTIENKEIQSDIVFDTYTDVKIRIIKAEENAIKKAEKVFGVYENEKSDYIKSFNVLQVNYLDGEPVAVWTRHGE